MFSRMPYLLGLFAVLTLVGCEAGLVMVRDKDGKPIEDANVEPVSLSLNGRPVQTDGQGKANVPLFIGQDVVWIEVSKQGYQTQHVDRPENWPLIIKLDKTDE